MTELWRYLVVYGIPTLVCSVALIVCLYLIYVYPKKIRNRNGYDDKKSPKNDKRHINRLTIRERIKSENQKKTSYKNKNCDKYYNYELCYNQQDTPNNDLFLNDKANCWIRLVGVES